MLQVSIWLASGEPVDSDAMPEPIDTQYGSDHHGVVWAYQFVSGRPGVSVTSDQALDIFSNQEQMGQEQLVWLHFSLSNNASIAWLRENFRLPETFYEFLGHEVGSTRIERDDDALVAIFHDVTFDFSFDASEVGATTLCIMPNLFVSIRMKPLRSLDALRALVRKGHAFHSSPELLAHLLQNQVNVLVEIQRRVTENVDEIEDQLLSSRIKATRAELGSMRRLLVRLQRLLAPEPAALFRLLNRPPDWISRDDLLELQHAAEEFSATLGDSAALVERVKLIQEELSAFVNERSGRVLFVLTLVTVLALPINLVAGLLGMNVGGIPFAESASGFAIVVALLVLLTAVLGYQVFTRLRH
jgi:zinc transporter